MAGQPDTAQEMASCCFLSVDAGNIVLVMGHSGSGKTTLLSMIGTLMSPTTGRILIAGRDTSTLGALQLSRLRLREFGFVFQTFYPALGTERRGKRHDAPAHRWHAPKTPGPKPGWRWKQLQLGHRLRNLPRDLSGGEKQRVAIARSLANDPRLILADESAAKVDGKTGQDVTFSCVKQHAGKTGPSSSSAMTSGSGPPPNGSSP